MKETWFVTGSSVGLGRSIAEAALAEGHDVVASARCADCKECCHEIDPCRTSCSGHGAARGAAHQPRRRVLATRWPAKETVADQSQGVQLAKLQRTVRYWGTDYDWRKGEAKLNALPMFVTEIDGLDIQFIHVRSRHENAMPLTMSHGWPGPRSWVERSYHKLIYFNEATRAATSRRGMSRNSSTPRSGRPSLQISALRAHRFSGAVRADEPSLKSGEEVGFRRRGS